MFIRTSQSGGTENLGREDPAERSERGVSRDKKTERRRERT